MSSKSVNLTASERESLTSLKQTSKMREVTERRLSTGLKVSWPAEDAPAYFVASSLKNRASDLTEKKDRIDQAINLLTAAQVALSGADSVLKQMQGLALSVTVADSETARQFNGLLNQLDNLINDAEYQGVNLLANQSASSTSTSVSSLTVEFSDKDESKVVINGEFAGSAYYMDAGGESKLIPASTGLSFTQSGVTGTQEARDASDVQVNTSTVNHQHGQDIAPMSDGGYLVVWEDLGGVDGDSAGVLAQRYDSSGVAVGVETQINTTTAGLQGHPTIATLSDGSYVVTWQAANVDPAGFAVAGQLFSSAGVAIGSEFQINTTTAGDQMYPEIAALNGGGFVVTWPDQGGADGAGIGVFAKAFNASGTAVTAEFQVNTVNTAGNQDFPRVAPLTDGGFVITWTDENGADGAGDGVYAKQYNSSGVAQGPEFRVATATANNQEEPDVAGLPNGGYVVTWHDSTSDNIHAKIYDSSGSVSVADFQVNTSAGVQTSPEVLANADGSFLVAWIDGNNIIGRRFDGTGTAISTEFQVNALTAANTRDSIELAELNNGDFVVTWNDNGSDGGGKGIYARRFKPGLTGGAVAGSNVTSADYPNDQVTVSIGGITQSLTVNRLGLGVPHAWYYQDFATAESREAAVKDISEAVELVRTISARVGGQISLLQTRLEFTDNYTNALRKGADKLTLADMNEEGANLLALQTRSQLGINSLSFASQSVGNILQLFK